MDGGGDIHVHAHIIINYTQPRTLYIL